MFASLLTFVFAVVGLAQPASDLPTVDQLLAKMIDAQGGKAAEEKINSRVAKGTIDVVTFGVSGPVEDYSKAPNLHLNRSEFAGYGEVLSGFDGKVGWASTPDAGLRELSGAELDRARRSAEFHGSLHMKDQYKSLTVTGKAKVGEKDVYVVDAQPKEGTVEKLYFDAQSGLMVKTDFANPQGGQSTMFFEDFKEVDGVKFPHTLRLESPEISLTIKFTEVKQNVPIEDAKFVKPAK